MASSESNRTLSGTAGEDLAVYLFVTQQADGEFDVSAAGDQPSGICAESVSSGECFPYVVPDGGIAKVRASDSNIVIGTQIASDANGKATTATGGAITIGRANQACGAAEQIIEVSFIAKPATTA